MVKKQNNNVWIIYVIALIAIAALILGAVAVYKANMTGNNIWSWLNDFGNKEGSPDAAGGGTTDMGLLANGEDISQLESYEVMFKDGEMVYETINGVMDQKLDYTTTTFYIDPTTGQETKLSQYFPADGKKPDHGCTASCSGGCGVTGCEAITGGCSPPICTGGGSCTATCTKHPLGSRARTSVVQ